MATQLVLDDVQTGTDIVAAVTAKPAIVLLDTEKFDVFYEALKAKAPTDADVATKKGRDALRSFAAEVRSEKASINKDRLRLTKEWRDLTSQVNEAGKQIDERLEALAVETRAPLTEWEEAEKARVDWCKQVISDLKAGAVVSIDDTTETVRARGKAAWEVLIKPETFGEMLDEAVAAKDATVATLKTALARLEKEEADRAELEKLRAAEIERLRVEEEKAAAAEIERRMAEGARLEEERKAAAEQAEKDRIAAAEKAAEERVRREAEEAAQAERDRVRREHEEALAAERAKVAEAERLREAEAARVAEQERQRAAKEAADRADAQRIAEQARKDEANKVLQRRLKTEAKEAIMSCGVSEDAAQKVVLAIRAGEIPHIRWSVSVEQEG